MLNGSELAGGTTDVDYLYDIADLLSPISNRLGLSTAKKLNTRYSFERGWHAGLLN